MNLVYLCCKESDDVGTHKNCLLVIEIIGVILYFYGDFIFNQHEEVLGCGQQCVENKRIAAIVTLGLATNVLSPVSPPCLRKIANNL